jgi:hypothetical protein
MQPGGRFRRSIAALRSAGDFHNFAADDMEARLGGVRQQRFMNAGRQSAGARN